MRPIDADQAMEHCSWYNLCTDRSIHAVQAYEIASIPTLDVAPVVRCKNCEHKGWVQEPCHGKSLDYCRVWENVLDDTENTFCSFGKEKILSKQISHTRGSRL